MIVELMARWCATACSVSSILWECWIRMLRVAGSAPVREPEIDWKRDHYYWTLALEDGSIIRSTDCEIGDIDPSNYAPSGDETQTCRDRLIAGLRKRNQAGRAAHKHAQPSLGSDRETGQGSNSPKAYTAMGSRIQDMEELHRGLSYRVLARAGRWLRCKIYGNCSCDSKNSLPNSGIRITSGCDIREQPFGSVGQHSLI